jgi:hypothetical protein
MAARYDADDAPISTLRYLAILSAAREFGVSRADIERVALSTDPLSITPRELADALADTLELRPAGERSSKRTG